eukprot:1749797-Amphidinium_carterae.1
MSTLTAVMELEIITNSFDGALPERGLQVIPVRSKFLTYKSYEGAVVMSAIIARAWHFHEQVSSLTMPPNHDYSLLAGTSEPLGSYYISQFQANLMSILTFQV